MGLKYTGSAIGDMAWRALGSGLGTAAGLFTMCELNSLVDYCRSGKPADHYTNATIAWNGFFEGGVWSLIGDSAVETRLPSSWASWLRSSIASATVGAGASSAFALASGISPFTFFQHWRQKQGYSQLHDNADNDSDSDSVALASYPNYPAAQTV